MVKRQSKDDEDEIASVRLTPSISNGIDRVKEEFKASTDPKIGRGFVIRILLVEALMARGVLQAHGEAPRKTSAK